MMKQTFQRLSQPFIKQFFKFSTQKESTTTSSQTKTQLGLFINNVDLNNLSNKELEGIKQALWQHGVICIKNQRINMEQQLRFSEKWGNIITIPACQAVDKRDIQYPAIVRIGNVKLDGTVQPNTIDAEYWHKDGDFRQPGENFLISILIPQEIAQAGGQTGFVCSEQVLQDLPENIKTQLDGAQIIVKTSDITDFRNNKPEDQFPEAIHPVFPCHPITGRRFFNIVQSHNKDILLKDGTVLNSADFTSLIEKYYKIHSHKWEMGDVLIWDNIRTVHKSMGGFGNSRRLLFRTQIQIPY